MIIRIAGFISAIFSSYFISSFRRIIYANRNNAPPIGKRYRFSVLAGPIRPALQAFDFYLDSVYIKRLSIAKRRDANAAAPPNYEHALK